MTRAGGRPTALSVKGRALRYLSQREHSRAELTRKLLRHVEDTPEASAQQQIDAALDALATADLLNEQRAADALVRRRAGRDGDRLLRQRLREQGLADVHIASALAGIGHDGLETELDRARALWQRRYGATGIDAADATARARQARFLAARGFEADTVRRVLREQGRQARGEPDDDLDDNLEDNS